MFQIGSLVRCRGREWIVLPSEQAEVLLLRPLGGMEAEVCGVYLPLEGKAVEPAHFDPPSPDLAGDFVAGQLLRDATRLSLRSGAGPFRSLGRLGVQPRPYQLVPLIMALRLKQLRLLIADDVGIGKTIEAGLIVRELLDRGEIRRLTVLCPPYLCDQWQRELAQKFGIEAVIVRSSTIASLARALPHPDLSVFHHYPFTVASIDYVKTERHRQSFLQNCPDLVIVDEAHSAARPGGQARAQQQRYELVRDVAADPTRHLVLLTATPHSGIEESFLSLLGLLKPQFETLSMDRLSEAQRDDLARHFVQRRRPDVTDWLGQTPFPTREVRKDPDAPEAGVRYSLPRASPYRKLFEDVLAFAQELVRAGAAGAGPTPWRVRVRYWAALALLRCVMSSPAAAEAALNTRAEAASDDDEAGSDDLFSRFVLDVTEQEVALDAEPTRVVEEASDTSERARLRRFAQRAGELRGAADPKLLKAVELTEELLRDGFNPILYCRYIATANYLAEQLRGRLRGYGDELRVLAVTGERSEEEREALLAELARSPRRVLVATDCLSEGINLQDRFDAVVHYDLPWNPNRLEQREGRVDRFGQRRPTVRTALLYGRDNPMDEAVMTVLLRKAVRIHRTLGISVPLPADSETVVETLVNQLFRRGPAQLSLFDPVEAAALAERGAGLDEMQSRWDAAVEREKQSRTRFAQRRIKPDEVARELEESDAVLGDTATVERFVAGACQRLNAPLVPVPMRGEAGQRVAVWRLPMAALPEPIRERLEPLVKPGRRKGEPELLVAFEGPAPAGVELVGRTHPLTEAVADYLLGAALTPGQTETPPASRGGVIRSGAVTTRTTLLLLRVRMLIEDRRGGTPLLAEEVVVAGYTGRPGQTTWLTPAEALRLVETAVADQVVQRDERRLALERALDQARGLDDDLARLAQTHAERLAESHNRVRQATGEGRAIVRPAAAPDLLGVYVLLPRVG